MTPAPKVMIQSDFSAAAEVELAGRAAWARTAPLLQTSIAAKHRPASGDGKRQMENFMVTGNKGADCRSTEVPKYARRRPLGRSRIITAVGRRIEIRLGPQRKPAPVIHADRSIWAKKTRSRGA